MKNEKINVYGMSCEHCVKTVSKTILALKGISSAEVSLKDKNATVVYDENLVNLSDIKKAVKESGYDID
jgi:copper ion binding protein